VTGARLNAATAVAGGSADPVLKPRLLTPLLQLF